MGLPQLTGVLLLLAAGPAHADRVVVIGQVPPPGAGQGRHELLDTADLVPADAGRRAERAEQARALAEGGRRAFTEARFAEAVTLLARARDAIVEIGFEGSSPDDLAQVSLVLGLAQAVTGDEVGADQSVRLALRLRPDLPLDPERFGPPARRRVERLRAEVDDARIPRVVTTEPIGAAIEIDGRPAGATPCTVELSLGPHVVLARASGRNPVAVAIDVRETAAEPVELSLPVADPRPAIDAALAAGDLSAAARLACATGAVDRALVIRPEGDRFRGLGLRCDGGFRRATARAAGALVRALLDPGGPIAVADAAGSHRERSRGGVSVWVFVAGAAAIVVGGVATALVLSAPAEPDRWVLEVEPAVR